MDSFLENAQRIFDVAASSRHEGSDDFALLIRPDGLRSGRVQMRAGVTA